jgi:hypothetical protein
MEDLCKVDSTCVCCWSPSISNVSKGRLYFHSGPSSHQGWSLHSLSPLKVTRAMFSNHQKPVLGHLKPLHMAYITALLPEKMWPFLCQKHTKRLECGVTFLYYGAACHCQRDLQHLQHTWDWEEVAHFSHSSDQSSSDYFCFPGEEPISGIQVWICWCHQQRCHSILNDIWTLQLTVCLTWWELKYINFGQKRADAWNDVTLFWLIHYACSVWFTHSKLLKCPSQITNNGFLS